jgi:hypothetical protein
MPNHFAILRVEKVKSFGELRGRGKHNARHTEVGVEHCDPDTAPELIAGQDDAAGAWNSLMTKAGLDPKGVRKNGTVALEWMATASPEWFANATPQEVAEWAHTSLNFIAKRAGGKFTVLSAHFHLDETTPHLQILTCPLVKKTVKKRGRKAAGAAEEPEGQPEWRLSAKDVIGGHRDRLAALQDDYAGAVRDLGLERGLPRKETGARNKPPSRYRAELARRGDELDEREAAVASKERDIERRAAILATVRRESGLKDSPDLEKLMRNPRARNRQMHGDDPRG